MSDEIGEYLNGIFSEHRVVLFMNGAVQSPAGAESMMALDLLTALNIEFHPVDISCRPTFVDSGSGKLGMAAIGAVVH